MSNNENKIEKESKGWVNFRPEIKVMDCTVRDGGLMNDHFFDDSFVKNVYEACKVAGVDYMELGYKANNKIFSPTKYGPWKFCTEDQMRKVLGDNDSSLKISVMADAERTDYHNDLLPKEQSLIDLVRVATYIHQIPTAVDIIKDAHDKGYETTINVMAISIVGERELNGALETLTRTPVDTIYLVDSFGSLYSEQIQYLTKKYLSYAESAGKNVGIHTHNNQQLAYSNTITALIEGANYLDATIDGMGRGAGNCPLELLLGFLHNPKFHIRPVLDCLQNTVRPLRKDLNWGYEIPYMVTGQLNQHPREAMKFQASETSTDFLSFYDKVIEEE